MKIFVSILAILASMVSVSRGQPAFLFEPESLSVSPGAKVLFQVVAYGDGPIAYQWQKGGTAMAGEIGDFLFLNSVTALDAADYSVIASTFSGSVTSALATLSIDATFTKITTGPLVTEPGSSLPAVWGDYDNDGYPDVFIPKGATDLNHLYHNNRNGTFTRILTAAPALDYLNTRNAVWADYDNDGWLDLLVVNASIGGGGGPFGGAGTTNILYRNNGDGTFSKAGGAELPYDAGQFTSAAWADYDRDGFLDLCLGITFSPNFLYRGIGNGDLRRVVTELPETFKITTSVVWGDFNNDGAPDLIAANAGAGGFITANEFLYTNRNNGTLSRQTNVVTTTGGNSLSCSWVDYDNDGDLDLFVVNTGGQNNSLYQNQGDGTFTNITTGELVTDGLEYGNSTAASWADFDNDGWIDVFVANDGGLNNLLYRNNRDGTFSKLATGSPANDHGNSVGCSWVDFDHDGFQDLYVSNLTGENFLYRNNGNANGWLNVRLIGDYSNRSGVGAKVRILATIHGAPLWQMREIAARDGGGSPNSLSAHFGLGDAQQVDLIRIEWPSGIIQEVREVSGNQFLTITEPPSIRIAPASVMEGDNGLRSLLFKLTLTQPTNATVTVDFFTSDLTATAGADYVATNGTVVFAPNQTTQSLTVNLIGDLEDETNETFQVNLTNSTVLPITLKQAVGTIIDDEPLTILLGNASASEGSSAGILFPVSLLKPVDYEVTVEFATLESTIGFLALSNVDFVATNGVLRFAPGETNRFVAVPLIDDALDEQNESFYLTFTNAVNAVLTAFRSDGVIRDDDPPPVVSLKDAAGYEGDAGTSLLTFEAVLSTPSGTTITVRYGTSNITAAAGLDYVFGLGTITFPPGIVKQSIQIELIGDLLLESNKTFLVNLFNPNQVTIGSVAIGTILDDDFRIRQVTMGPAGIVLTFPTAAGSSYRVEWSSDLLPPWTPLPGFQNVSGTGSPMQAIDPAALTEPQRFYRLRLLSP